MTRCSIVPPHVLAALARSDRPGPALVAARTLAIDASLRHERPPVGSRTTAVPPDRSGEAAPRRTIHDARGGEDLPGDVVRAEGDPPTGDPAADEAHGGLGLTWQLWAQEYGRDSLDGAGMPLLATVHYAEQYDCEHRDCATTWGLTLAYDRPCGCPRVDVSAPGGGVHQAAGRVGSDLIGA